MRSWTPEEALRLVDRAPVAEIQATPGFEAVARRHVENWLPRPGDNQVLAATMRDVGRFVSGIWATHLASSPGGLTLTRLARLIEGTQLSSPGRARALLIYLRFLGYIEPNDGDDDDRRGRRYRTTDGLREAFRERYRRDLRVYQDLDPAARRIADRIADPAVLEAFAWAHGAFLASLYKVYAPDEPSLELFSNRFSGMVLLGKLLLSGEPDDAFPPRRPLAYTVAGLARDAGISRAQVRRLLRDAERVGFFKSEDDGRLSVTPWLVHNVHYLAGSSAIILIECARAAEAYIDRGETSVI